MFKFLVFLAFAAKDFLLGISSLFLGLSAKIKVYLLTGEI